MIDYFLVAKIIASEGDDGFLKIESFTDSPKRFNKLKKVYLDFWGNKKIFSLEFVRKKGEDVLIKFKNFDNRKSVQDLLGKEVYVDNDDLVQLPRGYYFIHDLIGCKVFRNGVQLGNLIDVYSLEANDVYVIAKLDNEELLIPAVKEFIESIDAKNKILVLKPGEEFYENDED